MIFFTGWQALRKKGRVDDLQTSLLEEVLKSYFLANETRIPTSEIQRTGQPSQAVLNT